MNVPVSVPLAMAALLVVSAVFSASETALFSLEPIEVRKRTERSGLFADALAWCHEHARRVLITILLTNLASNTLYFALAGYWANQESGVAPTIVPIAALIVLVIGAEILPKSLALGLAGPLSSAVAPVLRGWAFVLAPVRVPLGAVVTFLSKRVATRTAASRILSSNELEDIVKRSPERFGLGKAAAQFVGELVGVTGIQVREVMVPTVDLTLVPPETGVAEARALMVEHGWRWLLVRSAEGVCGYVDAKQILVADQATVVADHVHELRVVPELARLPHLLELFRSARVDRVLAVDEYGHEAGVVGRDDLTETIVGGLARSEHEEHDIVVRLRPGRGWEVSGALGVHEFEDLFSVRMPIQRNRTIGGLLIEQLGELPKGGELVRVAGLKFEVLGVSRGRVRTLLVHFPEAAEPQP